MKRQLLLAYSLGGAALLCGQQAARPTVLKWDETKRSGGMEVFDSEHPTARWRLPAANRTAAVWLAYKVDSLIVFLGEMEGGAGEIVTILDAASKQEKAEFLCYEAKPSESGRQIAFRRFYPHFGTAEVSDRVQVIDLQHGVPQVAPPDSFHIPADDAGATIFPQIPVALPLRHRVNSFVWGNNDASLFFIDRLGRLRPEGGIEDVSQCLVRIDRVTSAVHPAVSNCLTSRSTGDESVTSFRAADLTRNALGNLVLSAAVSDAEIEGDTRKFEVDPETLRLSQARVPEGDAAFAIPWPVQSKQLVEFVPVERSETLKAHEHDIVTARVFINKDGTVESGIFSGSVPKEVSGAVMGAMAQWKFRGTILNGRPTKVVTSFETELGKLQDPQWVKN